MENNSEYKLIYNWTDIENRPNFIHTIIISSDEDAQNKLEKIIAVYQFSDKVKCGISRCNTKHNHGFLVKLKSNQEIIIGKDCGKRYFGTEFQEQRKLMNALQTEAEHFKILQEKYDNLNKMKDDFLKIMMPPNKLGIHKMLREIKKLTDQNEIINYWMIKELRQSQNISALGEITEEIRKTDEEMEKERQLKSALLNSENDKTKNIYVERIKRVPITKVKNFEIVFKTYEISALLEYFEAIHTKIRPPIQMKKEDRKKVVRELRKYENNIHNLKIWRKKAIDFLEIKNLLKLQHVFKDQTSKEIIKRWAEAITN